MKRADVVRIMPGQKQAMAMSSQNVTIATFRRVYRVGSGERFAGGFLHA
jgi:hypothetical protein